MLNVQYSSNIICILVTASVTEFLQKILHVLFAARECGDIRKDSNRPRDCWDIKQAAPKNKDGVYTVYVSRDPKTTCADTAIDVYCDMTSDGGGWTVCS